MDDRHPLARSGLQIRCGLSGPAQGAGLFSNQENHSGHLSRRVLKITRWRSPAAAFLFAKDE